MGNFIAHMAAYTPSPIEVIALQGMLPSTDSDKNHIDCHWMGLQRHMHTDLEVCHLSVTQVFMTRLNSWVSEQMAVQPCGESLE